MKKMVLPLLSLILIGSYWTWQDIPAGDEAKGTRQYGDYEKPETCKSCHNDIYMQWTQAMMSQAYTHHWDEIEYFDLAVAHAEKVPELKPVADGCNGCHAPLAFLAGDVPPPKPSENSPRIWRS